MLAFLHRREIRKEESVHQILKGSGNQGHLYGTALPARDKDALVEYLKTL